MRSAKFVLRVQRVEAFIEVIDFIVVCSNGRENGSFVATSTGEVPIRKVNASSWNDRGDRSMQVIVVGESQGRVIARERRDPQ